MVHAEGLLSLEARQMHRCSTFDILLEIDRILRPEVCFFFFTVFDEITF